MKGTIGFYGPQGKWEHDHSLVLMENGKVKEMIQLERLTRKKYDNRLPDHLDLINEILEKKGYSFDSYDLIYANTFSEDEDFFIKSYNIFKSSDNSTSFIHNGYENILDYEKVQGLILNKPQEASILSHELAHVFSSLPFFGVFKDNSLLIHIDGAASLCNASAWFFNKGKIEFLGKSREFHHSLMNFSYNELTFRILNIDKEKQLGAPGRLMGYASFGSCQAEIHNWLIKNDFFLNLDTKNQLNQFLTEGKKFGCNSIEIKQKQPFFFNIASCMQRNFEEKITEFILKYRNLTGADYLYYSGGAALNIILNSKLINSKLFKEIFIPPAANDSGLGLGCAAYYEYMIKHNEIKKHNPYLNNLLIENYQFNPNFSIDDVCKDIAANKVIGITIGNAEVGPRALGHRSIIANPSRKKMKVNVSEIIKKREWYRPLAPIVLESEIENLFSDYTTNPNMFNMLYNFKVKKSKQKLIPAVVHVDGTSRAQIISEKNPDLELIIKILKTMRDEYDVPCLINTSFNASGEPIVHTNEDALTSAKKMGLDCIIINNNYKKLR